MSVTPPEDLAVVLERCRAQRIALNRRLALAPDSLHRVLRCTVCQQWNLDTRVYEGFLQFGDGGQRACWSLDELRAFVEGQHRALHRVDKLDRCRCGAPAVALSLVAARFLHAMPGSGAELVVEVRYERDAVASVRFGRAIVGGAVAFLEEASEAALQGLFGVPLTVWGVWREVIAAPEGGLAAVEEGLALAAFPLGAEGFRAEFEQALRAEPELRAYGLSARVTAEPSWGWLRGDAHLTARPATVLVMMLRHDVLTARVLLLAAARGVGARREGDTVWLEDGLARWPVELSTVAEEGLRRGFTLSTMAAASVAHALDRVETLRTFLEAIEQLRPGVTFTVEGMSLVPSREGVTGRPIDLRVAPFGAVPDPETLDRDLRFYLREAPSWSDPWRVCPCGAAREVSLHRWRRADLVDLGASAADLVFPDGEESAAETVRVFAVSCERHVEYAVGALPGRAREAIAAQATRDLEQQRFAIKVAPYVDAAGRVAALVEAEHLLDATAHPGLVAGLVAAALGRSVGATVTTLSRELAVVAEEGAAVQLVERLEEVGRVLWTIQRGAPPTPVRAVFTHDATVGAAGMFVRGEGDVGVRGL